MLKITVLYGHPTDTAAFEKYYAQTHFEKVKKVLGIAKQEYTKFFPNPDGKAPTYYRMAELYFTSPEAMHQTMQSEEGKVMAADLPNFATGGVTIITGIVEK
ncbi:MAG: EthD family reductase [Bacteroidota bacterium]